MSRPFLFVANFLFLLLLAAPCLSSPSTSQPKAFKVFNALHYRNTPNLSSYGIKPINLIYEDKLTESSFLSQKIRIYSASRVSAEAVTAKTHPSNLVSLDMESWGIRSTAIDNYVKSIKEFKKTSPSSVVGLYDYVPHNASMLYDYYHTHDQSLKTRWQKEQKAFDPIAQIVDVNMPSLYTWGTDMNAWKQAAKDTVAWARRKNPGKPVYVFIWPQYYTKHSPTSKMLQGTFIPPKAWRSELETLYSIADGIIIWSSNKDAKGNLVYFNANMPWFQQTLSFMKEHHMN